MNSFPITVPMPMGTIRQPIKMNVDQFIGVIDIDFTVDIEMLPNGSDPEVEYENKHFHFAVPIGDKGDKGDTGNGISFASLNPDYTLTLYYTDGTNATVGPIRGQKGEKGDTGNTGVSISNIQWTSKSGLVDTYTITLTDSSTYTFTVTNGQDGAGATYSPMTQEEAQEGTSTTSRVISAAVMKGSIDRIVGDVISPIDSVTIESILDNTYTPT